MKFQRKVEAAALLATLSRFLNSPEGRVDKSGADLVEILGRSTPADEVELYVSGGALEAINAAFSPLPELTACSADAIPRDAAVLLTRQTLLVVWMRHKAF